MNIYIQTQQAAHQQFTPSEHVPNLEALLGEQAVNVVSMFCTFLRTGDIISRSMGTVSLKALNYSTTIGSTHSCKFFHRRVSNNVCQRSRLSLVTSSRTQIW